MYSFFDYTALCFCYIEEILFAEFNLLLKKGNRDLARIGSFECQSASP